MLRSPLLKKIILIILFICFGSILFSGFLINYTLNRQFRNYLSQSQLARNHQVVYALSELYQEIGGWDNLPLRPGFGRGVFFGNLLYVTDINNQIVLFIRRGMPLPPGPNQLYSLPIKVNNHKVGTAYFRKTMAQNLLSRQDELFWKTINKSIILAILITGFVSIIVAYLFAKRLSSPITEMNQIARNMSEGDLTKRVQDLPRDEVGELGVSINDLAERLNQVQELRKKMTADVAHDLRTPLTTVRSHLEGMIDEVIPASPENLASLLEEVKRLITLVNDLQEIANADTAVQRLKKEPLQLDLFLTETVKRLKPLFQEKGVILEYKALPVIEISSNRNALAKILDNLLSNALKFTSPGKKVKVELKKYETQIEIIISDEGIGIRPADLPFIFERFYRADLSRNRESGGFGLGLTIVKELVTALGGEILVESEVEEGSIFKIKFTEGYPLENDSEPRNQ